MKKLKLILSICLMLCVGILLSACDGKAGDKDREDDKSINPLTGTEVSFAAFTQVTYDTYSIKLTSPTAYIDLGDRVKVADGAAWVLTTDIQGNNVINSNVAVLTPGDNTYYVLVTAVNNSKKLYILQIRRKLIYTVTFNSNGGTEITNQEIEEDSFALRPLPPKKEGYTFTDWDRSFTAPITSDTTFNAGWQANT